MATGVPSTLGEGAGFTAGRIQPANYSPVDGDWALVLGSDLPGKVRDVVVGEASGIEQDVDLTSHDRVFFAYAFRQTEGKSAASRRGLETTYPVLLTDTDTIEIDVDGAGTKVVTFAATDTTLEDVVARINLALTTGTASADNGQLKITSDTTGASSTVEIVGGTVYALLGHALGTTTGEHVTFRFVFEIDGSEHYSDQPAAGEEAIFVRRTINVYHLTGTQTLRWYLEVVAA